MSVSTFKMTIQSKGNTLRWHSVGFSRFLLFRRVSWSKICRSDDGKNELFYSKEYQEIFRRIEKSSKRRKNIKNLTSFPIPTELSPPSTIAAGYKNIYIYKVVLVLRVICYSPPQWLCPHLSPSTSLGRSQMEKLFDLGRYYYKLHDSA